MFVNFSPEKIEEVYNEIKQFMITTDAVDITDLYDLYELHVFLSLMTLHDVEAKSYLDRITDQFGDENSERIGLLKALYLESQGQQKELNSILTHKKDELRLSRRLLTAYRNPKDSNEEYIKNLNLYLNLQPTDLVAWAELAEEYKKIGHYDKSIFCLKEVLLQEPLAYPVFYKVGLLNYYSFVQGYKSEIAKKDKLVELVHLLVEARNNFLRTIEICKDHKASWLGIYLICTNKIGDKLDKFSNVKEFESFKRDNEKLMGLSRDKVLKLNLIGEEELATIKLQ